jgi:hypothetical protein
MEIGTAGLVEHRSAEAAGGAWGVNRGHGG